MRQPDKKYVRFPKDALGMKKYIQNYKNQHSKFIHNSWLLLEDLGRHVTIEDKEYIIWGQWDVLRGKSIIMLEPVEGGPFRLEESQVIAHALGYQRMRNPVTGEEHDWDMREKSESLIVLSEEIEERTADIDENSPGEWVEISESSSEEDEELDPIVKALQDDIIDEGDIHAY